MKPCYEDSAGVKVGSFVIRRRRSKDRDYFR